jgi:hypothetical protein
MISCLLAGMDKNSHKHINYDKIKEDTGSRWKPHLFLNGLTEAMTKCTNLNSASQKGCIFLHLHFISQSAPDIQKSYKNSRRTPKLLQQIMINPAF